MARMHTGDYSITNETTGMAPEEIRKLQENESVSGLAVSMLSVYEQNENGKIEAVDLDFGLQSWESFQIAAVDMERLAGYQTQTELTKEDIEAMQKKEACLVVNPIPFSFQGEEVVCTQLKKGDTITVNGVKLQVAGITQRPVTINNAGFINGIQIIGTGELYEELTGTDAYSEVYPTLADNTEPERFEQWLDEWCQNSPGTHWLSYRQSDAQMAESFEQIRLLCWGLILFIGLIGVLNIINTVYTNIHTRVNEIGMQRAVGMSAESLYKTFLWEGAYYGMIASVIGAVCGYLCTLFVEAAANNGLQLVPFPMMAVLEATVASVATCLIATAIPLHGIRKRSIVESIEAVE